MKKKMRKIHTEIVQGTPEWHALRLKYPLTASKAQAIGNQGSGLETLVYERLSAKYSKSDDEKYSNKDLERGKELEPQARALYELETGNEVEEIGFVTDDEISKVGGISPDGAIIGQNGGVEIKCFEDKKHFRLSLDQDFAIESVYVWQMQQQMLFMEWDFVDFVAFNPNYQRSLLIKRVMKDEVMQKKIKKGLVMGEKLIKEIETKLK